MTTRTRLTRAESKARTRSALVDAGRRVFLERGYHGATLEAVAAGQGQRLTRPNASPVGVPDPINGCTPGRAPVVHPPPPTAYEDAR